MHCPTHADLTIPRGRTFRQPVRWETAPFRSVEIAQIIRGPSVRIVTQSPHGLTPGWRVAIVGARGLDELNAKSAPPRPSDMHRVEIIDATTVQVDGLSAVDCGQHKPNTGWLQWYSAHDLLDYKARLSIKDRIGGKLLIHLSDDDGTIVVDDALKIITLDLPPSITEGIAWTSGVHDLELESPEGDVFALLEGSVSVKQELTTPIIITP